MHTPIRFRALLLGSLLGLIMCALTPFNNAFLRATPLAGGHFPLAPFVVLVLLSLIAGGLRRILKRPALLTGSELLTVWALMVVVSGIGFTGLVRTFFINLTAPYHFATPTNNWAGVLHPLLPAAWYPRDKDAVELLYNGLDQGRNMDVMEIARSIHWGAWITPLMIWGAFIFLSYLVMFCLVNLLAGQWINNERVNFPLLRVPQLMLEAFDQDRLGGFFTNRYLITGLLISFVLHLLGGLHAHYPSVPQIPTLILAGHYFPETGLFSGFHKLKIYIYPAFIGFAFLTSRQISCSFWFFFLSGSLLFGLLGMLGLQVPGSALGVTFGPTMTRPEEGQMIGAYIVFFFFLIWLARHHIRDIAAQSFLPGRTRANNSSIEWLPPRYALWGVLLGMAGLLTWSTFFGMGMIPGLVLLLAFFMFLVVAMRIVCQGGLPYFTLTAAPADGILALFGSGFFSSAGLIMAMVMQKVLFVDLRETLMPSLMHAAKAGEKSGHGTKMGLAIAFSLILGVCVSFAAMLLVCHKYGIRELDLDWATRTTRAMYENTRGLIEVPSTFKAWVVGFGVMGGVTTSILILGYKRFAWWPLHPLGYLTTYSSSMRILWFSIFLGWMCNTLCLRYGGTGLFKKVRFLFVGCILGDFLMGGIWAVTGIVSGITYQVLPG